MTLQPSHKFKFVSDHWSVSREEPWCVTRKRDYIAIKSAWSKSENGAIKRLIEITETGQSLSKDGAFVIYSVTREKGESF